MTHETIARTSEEQWLALRTKDLTSTDIPVLFGLSPYSTYLELWLRKRDRIRVAFEDNDRMKWGRRLEAAIAEGIAEDQGFEVAPFKDYMRIPELRLGSSFDYAIGDDGLLELKNVDFLVARDQWMDGEAPPHIELQVQHQLLMSNRKYAYIGALVAGNQTIVYRRERDEEVIARIIHASMKFWREVDSGIEPAPVFPDDNETIKNLYGHADPNAVVGADEEIDRLAAQYKHFADQAKAAEQMKETAKARILMKIGTASKVIGEGYTITASMTAPKVIETYERAGYRTFGVRFKKEKAV